MKRSARLYRLCAAAATLWLAFAVAPAGADPWSELAQARRDLAISEQVQERLAARIEIARSDAATEQAQRRQLEEYAARVRDLVALNRERVRQLTQAASASPSAAAPASGLAPSAKSYEEEVAALEARLGSSLAEFDRLLLEEARRAKSHGIEGGGASGAGTAKGGDAGSKGSPAAGRAGEGNTSAGRSGEDSSGSQPAAGEQQGSPGGRVAGSDPGASGAPVVPPDVGDGRDDDIVARQIRRAAESEPDPELRKKLWDEYRKYRQGAKS